MFVIVTSLNSAPVTVTDVKSPAPEIIRSSDFEEMVTVSKLELPDKVISFTCPEIVTSVKSVNPVKSKSPFEP